MNTITKCFFLALLLSQFACTTPTVESIGGINLYVKFDKNLADSSIIKTAEKIKERIGKTTSKAEHITYKVNGSEVVFQLPGLMDKSSINNLATWDRMMRLCYSVEKSDIINIRNELGEFMYLAGGNKPYKSSSIIGLVREEHMYKVDSVMSEESFRQKFPMVKKSYWGVKKMEGKAALFMEAKDSPYIDEHMFQSISAYKSEDEGALSLELLPEYSDRIGSLTGNDSTFLLHIFHDEVYISKIIKPHITEPKFSMAGAFTTKDALILSTIWNTEEIEDNFEVEKLELIPTPE